MHGMAPYVCALVQKMQALLIDGQDARSVEGGGATTVDVEEGGAKHGEGADQAFTQVAKKRTRVSNKKYLNEVIHKENTLLYNGPMYFCVFVALAF